MVSAVTDEHLVRMLAQQLGEDTSVFVRNTHANLVGSRGSGHSAFLQTIHTHLTGGTFGVHTVDRVDTVTRELNLGHRAQHLHVEEKSVDPEEGP